MSIWGILLAWVVAAGLLAGLWALARGAATLRHEDDALDREWQAWRARHEQERLAAHWREETEAIRRAQKEGRHE